MFSDRAIALNANRVSAHHARMTALGAVQLSAPSSLVLDGGRYANAARFIADTGDIETSATLRGEETITLRANDGGIVNRGRIAGDKGVTLRTAKTVRNRGEVLLPTTIALDSAGGVTNHFGGQITSGSSLALNADTLDNAGTIAAKTTATIAVSGDLKNSGSLLAEQALRVNGRDTAALGTLSNPGETAQINGGEHLDIAATALVNEGQIGVAGGDLNNSGVLYSGGVSHYHLDGKLSNCNGDLLAESDLTIGGLGSARAGAIENTSGAIEAVGGDLTLKAQTITNARAKLVVGNALTTRVSRAGDTTTTRETLEGSSAAAKLLAGGALTVDAATLTNSYSQIAANSDIRLRADTVDNSGRDLIETVEKPM